jgi:hypothetical protein
MYPQPRIAKEGVRGRDVLAYKRAFHQWATQMNVPPRYAWPPDDNYGSRTKSACEDFQRHHGLTADGILGPHTYAALYPWLLKDPYNLWLVEHWHTASKRAEVKAQLEWLISHHDNVHYSELRPIPLARFRDHQLPVTTDCSGSIIGANFAAGAPDPSGLRYNGQGYTGSFLTHLDHVAAVSVRESDIVVFGAYPGLHAVAVLSPGSDPEIFTHGHEGQPDDPRQMPLSYMTQYFQSVGVYTVTYLSLGIA